ncbi:hypothetical protein V2I01_04865 [Micromonospora sp. BRA006-A]|nr:hypothetical protein [Micromonospora sp. BRA006-A]
MANGYFTPFTEGILDGSIDLDTATVKVALVRGYTFTATHRHVSDVTGAGGTINGTSAALTGKTVTVTVCSTPTTPRSRRRRPRATMAAAVPVVRRGRRRRRRGHEPAGDRLVRHRDGPADPAGHRHGDDHLARDEPEDPEGRLTGPGRASWRSLSSARPPPATPRRAPRTACRRRCRPVGRPATWRCWSGMCRAAR